MDLTLLKEGVIVMIMGMGTVFIFLVIMIFAMNINEQVLRFIGKYFPEEVPEVKTQKKAVTSSSDEEVAAAIACAIHKARCA